MITVPAVHAANLGAAFALGYLVFSLFYLGSAALAPQPPTVLAPSALDAAIPYLPSTIWVYLTQFLLLPTGIAAARDDADRNRTFYGMLVATVVAAIVFAGWPTQLERQAHMGEGITSLAWSLLYLADTPANCFPSLHVALAVIAGTALWRRGWRGLALAWPILISVSTLTTKQHVALDIAGGCALAVLAWMLTPKLVRHERSQPIRDAAGA